MITIVDYGLGNIRAIANVYKQMNMETRVARCAADLEGAERIVLPGVGAFDHAMALLQASGMRQTLELLVRAHELPVLGICVGMQMLARSSDEGHSEGLGWIPGRVRKFKGKQLSAQLPLPHMGWNDARPVPHSRLFKGLEQNAWFYFLHSFFFDCERAEDVAATTCYGFEFACAVQSGNVFGVQFHPEKSHHCGATLLRNFAEL
jgi:imidazole glycerol-phosphate synthase subunit HisH